MTDGPSTKSQQCPAMQVVQYRALVLGIVSELQRRWQSPARPDDFEEIATDLLSYVPKEMARIDAMSDVRITPTQEANR